MISLLYWALGAFVYTVIGLMAAYTVGFLIDVFTGIVFDIIFLGLRSVARCQGNKPEVLINMQKFTRESGESILKTFQAPRLLRTKSISYENLTGKFCFDSWKVGGVDLQQGFIRMAKTYKKLMSNR